MTPTLKKADYSARLLFDPAPSTIHVRDLIHMESHYTDRTSDYVTGMLLLASKIGIVNKTQACYFQVLFTIGVNLRKSLYQHEGHPFLGPDNLAIQIGGRVFGGSVNARAGFYSLDNVHTAHGYDAWVSRVLYRNSFLGDTDFFRNGIIPPKRRKDRTIITAAIPLPLSASSIASTIPPLAPAASTTGRLSQSSTDSSGQSQKITSTPAIPKKPLKQEVKEVKEAKGFFAGRFLEEG